MSAGKILLEKMQQEKSRLVEATQKDKFKFVQHQEDDLNFQVKFKDVDRYGIVLDYIAVSRGEPILDVDEINRRLSQQAEKVQKQITYLLEDFRLIELDRMNKRAQLRSYPPYEKENSKFFYEIVLDEGTRIHFQRYQYSREHKRYEKITSQLTLEIFERLVDDLASILK
ncbi:MAG: hypothetical protein D6715_00455 [Calditrichaeota bacterium]|nr:MAG: hypothetical protein D6715_00455 [Calditrichota bacterium]